MSANRQHFSVGDLQCIAISDGTFFYPPNWFFSNVPQEQLESGLRDHNLSSTEVVSPYTCLIIKTGAHTVLVDTGADGLAPTTGDLLKNLKAEGITPEDITTVVLTHAHPDHIGGVLDTSGKPALANARYVMSRTEWDFWTSKPELRGAGMDDHMKELLVTCALKNLPPLKPRMELLETEKEIVPGVYAIPALGHTPGHIALVISSAKEQLLHMADTVLHPMHIEYPAWRTVFDLNQEDAATTRRRLLDRAAADHLNVLAYHFPFPGLGHVTNKGNSWRWEAANAETRGPSDVP
jgi:glyoxylase-like metal-dependent hydrolase (beta-lactamase superfamily II)